MLEIPEEIAVREKSRHVGASIQFFLSFFGGARMGGKRKGERGRVYGGEVELY